MQLSTFCSNNTTAAIYHDQMQQLYDYLVNRVCITRLTKQTSYSSTNSSFCSQFIRNVLTVNRSMLQVLAISETKTCNAQVLQHCQMPGQTMRWNGRHQKLSKTNSTQVINEENEKMSVQHISRQTYTVANRNTISNENITWRNDKEATRHTNRPQTGIFLC